MVTDARTLRTDARALRCLRRIPACLIALLLVLAASVTRSAARDDSDETEIPLFTPSKYRIEWVHLPSGASGIQAATSRTRYRVNFGSREGVQPGSIFEVYQEHHRIGLVRVEKVCRLCRARHKRHNADFRIMPTRLAA